MGKRYTLGVISLLFAIAFSSAKQLSENEARAIAATFLKKSSSIQPSAATLKLVHIGTGLNNSQDGLLYVFNKGLNNGYIIVAGDDRVGNGVLGYADNGKFDYDLIPENMKYWLGEYERQIEYIQQYGIEARSVETSELTTSVAPLLGEIKWGQDAPYNLLCPTLLNGKHAAAGCVATAVAQIMYYWRWPEIGQGSHSYDWDYNNTVTTLSANFGNSKYEWDLMMPSYDNNSSNESQLAVAKLLSDVGISVNMDYDTSSGAHSTMVPKAMETYFNYDKSICWLSRDMYYSAEWEQILRDELNAGRVVYYAGGTYEKSRHAFLCDGYNEDGYFHFNWGWTGSYNGYFLTTAMDPLNQSVVGSDSGYDFTQEMIIGIQPEREGDEDITNGYVKLDSWEILTSECNLGDNARIDVWGMWNYYEDTLGFNFALNLYKGGDFVKTSMIVTREVTPPAMGWGGQYHKFYFPLELEDGNYRIYPQYKFIDEPDSAYRNMSTSKITPDYINVNIENGKVRLSFAEVSYKLKAKTFKAESYIVENRKSRVTATLQNEGSTEYYGGIFLKVVDSSNAVIVSTVRAISIDAGEEKTFICDVPAIPTKGFYTLMLCDEIDNVIYQKGIYVSGEESAPKLGITENIAPISYEMIPSDIRATAKIINTGGYFNGDIELMIYADNNIYRILYCYVTLQNGEEKTITFNGTFTDGVIGKEYNMALRRYDVTHKHQVWGSQVTFKLKAESSSVENVKKDGCALYPNPAETVVSIDSEVPISNVKLYSMSGILLLNQEDNDSQRVKFDVSSLTPGLYVLKIVKEDGTIETFKLKKK